MTERLLYRNLDLTMVYAGKHHSNGMWKTMQCLAGIGETDQSHVLPYILHLKLPERSRGLDMDMALSRVISGLKNIREITYSNTSGVDNGTAGFFFERYPHTRVNLDFNLPHPCGPVATFGMFPFPWFCNKDSRKCTFFRSSVAAMRNLGKAKIVLLGGSK